MMIFRFQHKKKFILDIYISFHLSDVSECVCVCVQGLVCVRVFL